jgi:hypothetical protein
MCSALLFASPHHLTIFVLSGFQTRLKEKHESLKLGEIYCAPEIRIYLYIHFISPLIMWMNISSLAKC